MRQGRRSTNAKLNQPGEANQAQPNRPPIGRWYKKPVARILQIVTLALLANLTPAAAQTFFGGGGGKPSDRVSWGLCVTTPCTAGATLTVAFIVLTPGKMKICYLAAGTPPAGAALIFAIRKNGTEMTTPANRPTLADGASSANTNAFTPAGIVAAGDLITVDILQIGVTQPGRNISLACKIQ